MQTPGDESQAESIARTIAGAEVVSNQIAVISPVVDVDKGVESNLDVALIEARLHDSIHDVVWNGVVTLTGELDSQSKRRRAETVAAGVPNVLQVVNQVKIRGQKIWRVDRN